MSADIQSGQKKKRKRQVSRLKAISRNEKYLSKLSGEEEVVPKPISREERYMYRACGYVDRPIPEHAISREEKYWKKIIENGGGGSAVLTSKDITENGLYYAADDEADGYSSVNVDVPNTYLLSDEGKVVSNGTLVSQTSSSVTQNGVVDTTLIDSINVSVNNSYTQQDEGKVVNSGRLISQTSSTAGQNGIVDTTLINSLNVNVPDTNTTSGILPYVIHTSETALRSWTIYGNNTPHIATSTAVLPLTFTTVEDKLRDWEIRGNDDVGENLFDGTYQATFIDLSNNKYTALNNARTAVIQCDPNSQYTISVWSGCNRLVVGGFETEPQIDDTANILASYTTTIPQYIAITTGANVHYIACYVSNQNNAPTVSIVRGSTPPSSYIPYQQGVGQRTANLFDGTIEQGGLNNGAEYNSSTRVRTTFMSNMLDAGTYTINASGVNVIVVNYFDDNKTYTGGVTTWRTLPFTFNISSRCYVRFAFKMSNSQDVTPSDISNTMLVEGSTAPAIFEPYGYKIPITVNSTPQTFYIGDSPLTAGQSISKTSTGVDISAVQGANTITTDLYNKPEMSIEGVDYVGVGERSGNDWQIPLTVSDGTSTTSVNVPIDAPLTEGESITDTQTISTFTGENTIGTTMTNKPNMDTVYIDEYNNLINKTITQNGTYSAADDSASGYSKVTVNVPAPPAPMLITKTITASGIYTAASDNADGYSEVTVNMSSYNEFQVNKIDFVITEVTS